MALGKFFNLGGIELPPIAHLTIRSKAERQHWTSIPVERQQLIAESTAALEHDLAAAIERKDWHRVERIGKQLAERMSQISQASSQP